VIVKLRILMLAFAVTAAADSSSTKGWRGIIPLKSTRADVERLLGPSRDKVIAIYPLPEGRVTLRYSQHRCDGGWNVPAGTVLFISINPEPEPLANLKLDLTRYRKEPGDYDVLDHFYYRNEEEGLSFSVLGEIVLEHIYGPTAADRHLRCPNYSVKDMSNCLPVLFRIECSSEAIKTGSPAECRVIFWRMPKDARPTLKWTVSKGGKISHDNADSVESQAC